MRRVMMKEKREEKRRELMERKVWGVKAREEKGK